MVAGVLSCLQITAQVHGSNVFWVEGRSANDYLNMVLRKEVLSLLSHAARNNVSGLPFGKLGGVQAWFMWRRHHFLFGEYGLCGRIDVEDGKTFAVPEVGR